MGQTLTLRGIPTEALDILKARAREEDTSLNKVGIDAVLKGLGIAKSPIYPTYEDLDCFAGTWTQEEYLTFNDAIKTL